MKDVMEMAANVVNVDTEVEVVDTVSSGQGSGTASGVQTGRKGTTKKSTQTLSPSTPVKTARGSIKSVDPVTGKVTYGFKKDGTPRKAPGRRPKAS